MTRDANSTPAALGLALLARVQKAYPTINKAAGEMGYHLTKHDIRKDILLAAELAGLVLLRDALARLKEESGKEVDVPPGTAIIGTVGDEAQESIFRFFFGVLVGGGFQPQPKPPVLSANDMAYLPEVTNYEPALLDLCQRHSLERSFVPFVAAASAAKLVGAGNQLHLLDGNVGAAIAQFHMIAGMKTFPYPRTS